MNELTTKSQVEEIADRLKEHVSKCDHCATSLKAFQLDISKGLYLCEVADRIMLDIFNG